ncbi:MAG: hypothetical protein JSV04_13180 [Candidatus Heimdallarchaeota archaeon]|nr:MAG: hypothetical protein JSV04_13180 [Candidatus Heimdallarchaeota archaeon]
MTRHFIDSLSSRSESQLSTCLDIAYHLGFSEIWISNPSKIGKNVSKQFSSRLRIYERLDIGSTKESKAEIISILRQRRRKIPIIAITCLTPELTAWAAQDNRVDILKFPVFQTGKLMTRSIAKLMVKFDKHLEIPLAHLYSLAEHQQISVIRQIRAALENAIRKKVPILFTSGSSRADQMRSPRELASLGQMLLSESILPLDSLSIIPQRLLQQNLIKITPNYLAPGVFKVPLPSQQEEE